MFRLWYATVDYHSIFLIFGHVSDISTTGLLFHSNLLIASTHVGRAFPSHGFGLAAFSKSIVGPWSGEKNPTSMKPSLIQIPGVLEKAASCSFAGLLAAPHFLFALFSLVVADTFP